MTEIYCGPAPTPENLFWQWNIDFTALALCAGLLAALKLTGTARVKPLAAGLALLLVLFLSPFCALTAALFSARAAHHVLMVAIAAPMLALALPGRNGHRMISLGWIAAIHAAIFWLWHAPPVYAAAITHPVAYWLMQLGLLGSGVWFWRRVFDPGEETGIVLLALLGTIVQMGMLGALLTFSAAPLYGPHLLTTIPFGLTPLQDQQLGGVVMWVPAALPYLAAAIARIWPLLGSSGRSARWSG